MKLLEERILKDGIVREGNVLKVDSFVNHQIDVDFIAELAKEFKRLYEGEEINKILTIEASGIGIACIVAREFHVPVVFAKKTKTINIANDVYTSQVESFTHKRTYDIIVSKDFLKPGDKVLFNTHEEYHNRNGRQQGSSKQILPLNHIEGRELGNTNCDRPIGCSGNQDC